MVLMVSGLCNERPSVGGGHGDKALPIASAGTCCGGGYDKRMSQELSGWFQALNPCAPPLVLVLVRT